MGRLARRGGRRAGQDPGPVPRDEAPRAGPRAPGRVPGHRVERLHQLHPARAGAVVPGRRDHGAAHPGLRAVERGRHGHPGQRQGAGHRRPPRHLRQLAPPSTRSASTTSSGARTTASPATRSSSRATPPPASTPGPSSKGGSAETQLDNFRQEIGGNGLSSYPHPRLMPDFWEFPTVSMGIGPINAIYQARFNRYLANRRIADTSRIEGLGLPGRRRVRRARVPRRPDPGRERVPRQPHLRRQLQPPAPRRPRPGQRQDHPGAGSRLPGRGVERHQGHLGLQVGRAPRPRRRRRPRQQDEHHPRRRVPEVLGRVGRLHPPALLRPRPPPAGPGRAPLRRRAAHPAPGRPRLPQALRRLPGRGRARGRAHRHPGQDHQGLDPRPRRRGPQRHPPDQEDVEEGPAASSATGSTSTTCSPTRPSRTPTSRPTTARPRARPSTST